MPIHIRQEIRSDYPKVAETIIATYEEVEYSNHKEQLMVERLRSSAAFVPELSLVAEDENGGIVGHILLTTIEISNNNSIYPALALAPISILPAYQNQGVGKKLVNTSHRVAKDLGYSLIVILGIPNYYFQFGYELASRYNLKFPIKVAEKNSFIISLDDTNLSRIKGGTVKYSPEFFG